MHHGAGHACVPPCPVLPCLCPSTHHHPAVPDGAVREAADLGLCGGAGSAHQQNRCVFVCAVPLSPPPPPEHAVPWQHRVRATVHAVSPLVWLPVLQNAWPAWTTARTCCTCSTTRFSRSPPVMWCWCAAPCSAVDPATSWWRRWIPREIRYARARCGGCAGRTKKAHALTRHPTATDPHPEGMRPCYH